jgi:endoglucanase Acf2
MRTVYFCLALALVSAVGAWAQDVVAAGKGSYASQPPAWLEGLDYAKPVTESNRTFHVINQGDRPILTNSWCTSLFINGSGELWADPLMAKPGAQGTELYAGTHWQGKDMAKTNPLRISGDGFTATDQAAKEWSDWMLTYRAVGTDTKYYDVTIMRGSPTAWVEFTGLTPTITIPNGATYFDADGVAGPCPTKGDTIGIVQGGNTWAIFAPDDTTWALAAGKLTATFAGDKKFLAVSLLTDVKDVKDFHKYAFAIPRTTTLSWKYDKVAGTVKQTWAVAADALKGTEKQVIMGWIPHHYQTTKLSVPFAGYEYATPRGKMKTTIGSSCDITYNFSGILPAFPAPAKSGGVHDYNPDQMAKYLTAYAGFNDYRDATYWGGKDILQKAWAMTDAKLLGDASAATDKDSLKTVMTDWMTYTPEGKDKKFFYYYPNFKGLVGWHEEFWTYQFTDHHFHYGYFTMASALLGLQDPQWLKDYGPMAKLVAKEYANWDHADKRFPFFRTWDKWEGHSWAGGFSSPTGENEESSSEDMQSWGGMYLLGCALGDEDMIAAGAMGWAANSQSVLEYWFNQSGENFPATFGHPVNGMVWGGGLNYGNYFTGDMAWTYGIQLMPNSPALQYFDSNPNLLRKVWEKEFMETRASEGGKANAAIIDKMGTGLGNVMLGHACYFDADWDAQTMDELIASGSQVMGPTAADNGTHGSGIFNYYNCHSLRNVGHVQFDMHIDVPMSTVFLNETTKVYSYCAWNATDKAVTATVYSAGKKLGTFKAEPQTMTVVHELTK